ncbi:MAG: hypothetical protein AAF961_03550, partial [Planctomycetota bacterium]
PMTIEGLDAELEFHRDQQSIVPSRENDNWVGFLPATGRAEMQWTTARQAGEGKLFFTTTGRVEAQVGAGLLRQEHQIDYHVLQGELASVSLLLHGPGEILDVQGGNIVAWQVTGEGDERRLDATLSQPITSACEIKVRSQTPLGAFPMRVEGLRLEPVGAIRHAGHLRLTNQGSVRLEPSGIVGLTQLAPDQFPGDPVKSRQVFVYRFPAADHAFAIVADRIQPEVNVAELVLYELSETDRVIRADVELDVREAPIREWELSIPADYSVVSVSGASVTDYVVGSEVVEGRRMLKALFGQDVAGRQLVTLHFEKSEPAAAGDWALPRIEYPDAKTVRGDIGVIGAPGFRIAAGETDLLVEKALAYFPKPTPGLQQAFRIREPGWSATMRVERLERSVQSDVFHLYSLSQETVYGSALINFVVTGAPVSEWRISVPQALGNVMVDGQDVRTWRREGDTLTVFLHQPVMGAYTLLLTFEEDPDQSDGTFQAGRIAPIDVQGERGYVHVVSPTQVEISTESMSDGVLVLDSLELPAELRLLSAAPSLGTWQYTVRPFALTLGVKWFEPGAMATQVVEFSEANSRVSQDGELVTDVLYYVKSRGQRTLRFKLPGEPVRLWEASVNGQPVTARQADDATLIPLPGDADPNTPVEVRLRLGKPSVDPSRPKLTLPIVDAPVLKTQWNVAGDESCVLVPHGGSVAPPTPVLRPTGFDWLAKRGVASLILIGVLSVIGMWASPRPGLWRVTGLIALAAAIYVAGATANQAFLQMGSPAPLQLSLPILSASERVELEVKNIAQWRANLSWIGLASCLLGVAATVWSCVKRAPAHEATGESTGATTFERYRTPLCGGGVFLVALGVLLQRDSAAWFFALLGLALLVLLFVPPASQSLRNLARWAHAVAERRSLKKQTSAVEPSGESGAGGVATTALLIGAFLACFADKSLAEMPAGFKAADSIKQQWQMTHEEARLVARGTVSLSG